MPHNAYANGCFASIDGLVLKVVTETLLSAVLVMNMKEIISVVVRPSVI